jgi:hypothetical protein
MNLLAINWPQVGLQAGQLLLALSILIISTRIWSLHYREMVHQMPRPKKLLIVFVIPGLPPRIKKKVGEHQSTE